MKICTKCGLAKDVSEYKKHRQHQDGLYGQCKACVKEYRSRPEVKERALRAQRKRYLVPEIREKIRSSNLRWGRTPEGNRRKLSHLLKHHYGITMDEYDMMLASQNNACAICNTNSVAGKRRMHVDHDHETGVIRGILCHHCNTAIGAFKENEVLLQAAIEYLKKHKSLKFVKGAK